MEQTINVTTTGSAGSATGAWKTKQAIEGFVEAIKITRNGSTPDTTTVIVTEVGGMGRTLATVTLSSASVTIYPTVQATDNTGAAVTGAYRRLYVGGRMLNIAVAVSDAAADAVTVIIVESKE